MVKVFTSMIAYSEDDRMDITFATTDMLGKIFAPTREMVMGIKLNTITKEQYLVKYKALLEDSRKRYPNLWDMVLNFDKVVLCCYCNPNDWCHRRYLAQYLGILGAEYVKEIYLK
jgi:uncharacterized protein YeaO (DUF488 family)